MHEANNILQYEHETIISWFVALTFFEDNRSVDLNSFSPLVENILVLFKSFYFLKTDMKLQACAYLVLEVSNA